MSAGVSGEVYSCQMSGIETLSPSDERERLVRGQIRDAAALVFERDGFRRATMADIAKVAGVSRKTVYNYFDNKTGLIGAVIEHDVKLHVQRARDSLDLTMPADKLLVEAELRLLDVARDSKYVSLLVRPGAFDVSAEVLDPHGPTRSTRHDYWFPVLESIRRTGQLRSDDLAEVAEWLSAILLVMLVLPTTFGGRPDSIRDVMQRYLVPSVIEV